MAALNRTTLHAAWRQHVGPVWKSRTAAAVVADVAARAVSGRRLYHGLADGLRAAPPATKKAPDEAPGA